MVTKDYIIRMKNGQNYSGHVIFKGETADTYVLQPDSGSPEEYSVRRFGDFGDNFLELVGTLDEHDTGYTNNDCEVTIINVEGE